jgi:HEAT repeat protein
MRKIHQKRIVLAAALAALATVAVAGFLLKDAAIERICLYRLGRLGKDDHEERRVLERTLIRVRSVHAAPYALPWIERIGDEEIPRYWEEVGPGAVPFLLRYWKESRDDELRWAVLHALEWMGPRGAASIPFFLEVLSGGEPEDRIDAAWALASLDPDPARATAALAAAARDCDPRMRAAAMRCLGKVVTRFPPAAPGITPAMLEGTADPEGEVRADALRALAAFIGEGVPIDIPERLLEDLGQEHAGRILLRLWLRALDDPSSAVRAQALQGIGALGDEAGPAIHRLAAILRRDPTRDAKIEAARALWSIGPGAAAAAPALEEAARSDDQALRNVAAEALGRIGSR